MACSSVTDVKFKLKLSQCQKEFASSVALELREYQEWGSLFVSKKDHAWQNSLPLLDPLVCIGHFLCRQRRKGRKIKPTLQRLEYKYFLQALNADWKSRPKAAKKTSVKYFIQIVLRFANLRAEKTSHAAVLSLPSLNYSISRRRHTFWYLIICCLELQLNCLICPCHFSPDSTKPFEGREYLDVSLANPRASASMRSKY